MVRKREKHPGTDDKAVEAMQEEQEIEAEEVKEEIKEIKKEVTTEVERWKPNTELGKKVKEGQIKDIDVILKSGQKILEPEIVDMLVPNLEHLLMNVGQSKGKFGGGKKSIWRQTQKKTMEGNKPKFATVVAIGNKNGYLGIGFGKAKETVPAREKAIKNSKLNIIKVRRGCGEWACRCAESHSIPYTVYGKCGSVKIYLKPAPKGTGLRIENECQKLLKLAGIKDIYSKSFGQTKSKINMIYACFEALKNLTKVKATEEHVKKLGIS